ncbi:MAG: pyridoxal phosphate-dependent aminotransferase [Bacteroidetes bacterium]|nr:pyridoxal phosphate-dependent aminotransferase [Bacteroidota bacterium]
MVEQTTPLRVSQLAENIIGSEIIRLAAEVNEKIKKGEKIYNLTIGDFNPKLFPIPAELKSAIITAYENDETNYPSAEGMIDLRNSVSAYLKKYGNLNYGTDEIVISGGARPLIYSAYRTLIDPDDVVVFPTPSWNNNHYCHLTSAKAIIVETTAENNFMPTAAELKPFLKDATMLALCSPLNPTGTTFSKNQLREICELVLDENRKRDYTQKPLYLLYDQIYWALTFGDTKHYDPVSLLPEMKKYTIYIDGISKSLAATGVRVGWAFGPKKVIDKMKSIIGHVGAWAPKAEQMACADYLSNYASIDSFMVNMKEKINSRLQAFYTGFTQLQKEGFKVACIAPQAAIYLTAQFRLIGMKKENGEQLSSTKEITAYLLNEAKIAIVPFYAFGDKETSDWYRISVGTCKTEDIPLIIDNIRHALKKLS